MTGLHPAQVEKQMRDYLQWHKCVHVVSVTVQTDGQGLEQLVGVDFRRTPGYGQFTYAVGVEEGFQGMLASQQTIGLYRLTQPVR